MYYTPTSLGADGTCPHCKQVVDWKRAQRFASGEIDATEIPPIPWHFKLLLGAAVLYLGFRAWEGIEWLFDHL